MFCEKTNTTSTLPGSWLPNIMYPQTQGTPATSMVPQAYPSPTGYYMPHLYQQQHGATGYNGYGMVPGSYPYQKLPGMHGTPSGYGTASSSTLSSSVDSGSSLNDNDSVMTSPEQALKPKEITGVLYKTTGGRVRKKPLETGKPPYSYISLICMAISDAPDKKATLREICDFIANRFPYYQTKTGNWHGNIRHNLTLNDCFVKMPRRAGDKGHPWAIDPSFEDMFDNGSLLRRKYRYKPGSAKWNKSQAQRGSPKKRGRKTKDEAPKNALVIPQPDGSSKLVSLNERDQSRKVVQCAEIISDTIPAYVEIVPKPGTKSEASSPSSVNNQHQESYNSSSPCDKMVKTEQNSHNSTGSSYMHVTSPALVRSTSMGNSTSSSSSGSHLMQSPYQQQPASFGYNNVLQSPETQTQQHTSPMTHQSPLANQGSPNGTTPARVLQSPDFHTPPSAGSQNSMLHQSYFNYRGYAACYPMASSTPTPACSYPTPLGSSYLPSPCSSGSQLYQGLQSDYYSLLSSSTSQ